jgi:hypothetical protein
MSRISYLLAIPGRRGSSPVSSPRDPPASPAMFPARTLQESDVRGQRRAALPRALGEDGLLEQQRAALVDAHLVIGGAPRPTLSELGLVVARTISESLGGICGHPSPASCAALASHESRSYARQGRPGPLPRGPVTRLSKTPHLRPGRAAPASAPPALARVPYLTLSVARPTTLAVLPARSSPVTTMW